DVSTGEPAATREWRDNPPPADLTGRASPVHTDSTSANPRIAIVHDWLDTWRGGENVLAEVLAIFPDADLFALVDFLPDALRNRIGGRRATTSFLQRIPGA